MSNALAIAAATATLRYILQQGVTADPDLNDATVTIQPLDKARGANTANQLNLFLYQIQRNAAWVSRDMPRQLMQGESGFAPLPLNLWYLVTAFGRNDDADNSAQPFGHHLLGKAMSVLHDHAVLSAADIVAATQTVLPASDLDRQVERIRITFQPLSVEEVYRLWTGFATQYRLSAAYELAVTLIESTRTARTPLPTLTRGPNDQGFNAQANLLPPLPGLLTIAPPNQQPGAALNDIVTISGYHLDGSNVVVRFAHALWSAPVDVNPEPGATATQLSVRIPNDPASWPAGFYAVEVLVQRPGETFQRATNQLQLALAPRITLAHTSTAAANQTYTVTNTVTSVPQVWPAQRAALLFGDQEIVAPDHPAQTGTLVFEAAAVAAGDYLVRLRVDGVDSPLVNRSVTPPAFDSSQKVTVP
ncbi:MAG TPA: DUF4255 domain-containing protein [Paraburkholderia sp.]|nr:DUF4255 domain-containing protein [Paraburkholderia sp.]